MPRKKTESPAPKQRNRKGQGGKPIWMEDRQRWRASYLDAKGLRQYVYDLTEQTCQAQLNEKLADVQRGISPEPYRATLRDFLLDKWLPSKRRLNPDSREKYRYNLEHYVLPDLGRFSLQRLQGQQIEALWNDLLDDGLSGTMVGMLHDILKQAMRDALRWNLVARSPMEAVRVERGSDFEGRALAPEEARAFRVVAKGHRLAGLWQLALLTGMRKGELLGLAWEAVDFGRWELHIRQTLKYERRGRGFWRDDPKTEKSRRTLKMSDPMIAVLREHQGQQLLDAADAGKKWGNAWGLVFTTAGGAPEHEANVTRMFHRLLDTAGVERVRFHDLRHTAATYMLRAGVPVGRVSEVLGHSSVLITMRVYQHALPGDHEAALAALGRVFDE